jgi:hypothetical protein
MKTLIRLALLLLGASVLLTAALCGGCTQRECSYDPKTGLVHYKSVSFATDASADIIRIKTPSGVHIEIVRIKQDNDSIKLVVPPYGAIETKD